MVAINPKTASWSAEYPFEPQTIKLASGATMSYVDEGPRDAPAMVFFHGNPTWSFYWRNLIKHYSGTFRCVAMDHIGCGLSEKPQDYNYTLEQRISDAAELVTSLGLRNAVLVVHDWGGAIGFGVAERMPDLFEKFIVFNTAAFLSPRIPFSIDICRIPGFGAFAVRGLNAFVEIAQIRAIHDRARLAGPIRDAYVNPYDSWENRVAIHRFVEDIPMKPSHPSYATLKRVDDGLKQFADRPMLIVWGDEDFCFDVSFRKEWQRRFPNATVHALADASHYVVEDAIDDIKRWADAFLA
ncbi:MAG: alpha/beta fold hydrolase [bacterium]